MIQRREFVVAATGGLAAAAGCIASGGEKQRSAAVLDETLTLTTTRSTYDTGLLDEINLAFENRYGARVEAVPQGTGAALETARSGDADAVLVHARSLEDKFIRGGYGINRRNLMFNDFVVVGPESDPAGLDGLDSVTQAFSAIADAGATFISRGDNSGTHTRERTIWDETGVAPGGEWYREAGSGMGQVLTQADQTPGYTLADRGTYLSQRSVLDISVRLEGPIAGGPELLSNPYGVIAVNPAVHEHVNYDLAMAYIGFLTSQECRDIIEGYTVDGEQLFFPEAVSADPSFQQYVPEGWTPTEE